MSLVNLLNYHLSWHDRKGWSEAICFLEKFFKAHNDELLHIKDFAGIIRYRIDAIDSFIQRNTAAVCPSCESVCCVNKHGFYDYEDLIYIYSLGLKPPVYKEGVGDTDPCQFLSDCGCTIERALRPFRCNWYFCSSLLKHMENGPARAYRSFIRQLDEILDLRKEMLDGFFRIVKNETP
jgi:hypothetical protein